MDSKVGWGKNLICLKTANFSKKLGLDIIIASDFGSWAGILFAVHHDWN